MSRRSKYDSSGGALASSAQAQDISPGPQPGGTGPDIEFAGTGKSVEGPLAGTGTEIGEWKGPEYPVTGPYAGPKGTRQKQRDIFLDPQAAPQYPFLPAWAQAGLSANRIPNRKFFLNKVLKGYQDRKGTQDLLYDIDGNYINYLPDELSADQLEKIYDQYMKARLAGEVDAYGRTLDLGNDTGFQQTQQAPQDYRNDPDYIAWLKSKGVTIDDEEEVEEDVSTGKAGTVYPYEFYGQPDYETSSTFESYLARGGRVPAAFGGIMDTNTGRKAYGLGSIFKGVKKAIGKVLGSPVGMGIAALTMGGGLGGLGRGLLGVKGIGGPAHGAKLGLLGKLGLTQGYGSFLPTWTGGILGLSSLPFFGIGTQAKQDTLPGGGGGGRLINPLTGKEDSPAGIRTSLNEAIVEAGDDPDKIAEIKEAFPFVNLSPAPFDKYADGGRIGFAAGGMDFYTDEEGNYREGAFKEKAKEIGGSYDKGLLDFGAGENMVFDLMHKKYELGLSMEEAIAELEKEWEESIVEGAVSYTHLTLPTKA